MGSVPAKPRRGDGRHRLPATVGCGFPADLLPDGVALVLDLHGRVLAHGVSLPSVFFRTASLIGHPAAEIGPPALGDCLQRIWNGLRRRARPCTAEVVIGPDASDPSGHLTLSLRAAAHPETAELTSITVRDVTRDRDREQGLRDTIERLRFQRDEWEAAARRAAHDVHSSLTALTGFIDLALPKPGRTSADAPDNLEQALKIGRRIHALLEAVLEEEPPCGAGPLAIGPMGHGLFTALRAAYPSVPFTWCVAAADHTIQAPSTVVWDVLWNLLVNAIRYRHPERTLHVDLRSWKQGAELSIEVRDNGRGISTGEEERIFQFRRRGSNALDVKGTGLGLYSARRLLEACGGRVWAEPSGEGSTFRVALPVGSS
jgi:signal transduction histidine kinase